MENLKNKLLQYKIIVIIVCVAIILGCIFAFFFLSKTDDSFSTSVENGSQEVVKNDEISITKDDIYYYFLENYGTSQIVNDALAYIADQEIDDQDAINAKVEETKTTYETYTNMDFSSYVASLDYDGSEEDYINENLVPDAKLQLLQEKYIETNLTELIDDYQVRYLKIITVDTESQALKIIEGSSDEDAFNTYMNDNNGSDAGLVTNADTIVDEEIINLLEDFNEDGVYGEVIKTSDSKYAVVWVYNTDTSDVEDDIKTELASQSDISTRANAHYLKSYNFDVYESSIKDAIKENNEDYFG